jgi:ATP-binding protein involved in chromosome partitioning
MAIPDVPIIAVASGKGGVGKTTVAVNLALALHAQGRRVGLIDADLYGPDVPRMFGLRRRAHARQISIIAGPRQPHSKLEKVNQHGIDLASAAFLLGESQAVGVEAPIAQLLVRRLFTDIDWSDVDCLVVDLPPGTADIQQFVLALRRKRLYVLLVVTPQVVAHQDVRRLVADLRYRSAVTLGGVENMSTSLCPHCGEQSPMFPSAPEAESIWNSVPKLVSVPFHPDAARDADHGRPVMVSESVPAQVAVYTDLAEQVAEQVFEK